MIMMGHNLYYIYSHMMGYKSNDNPSLSSCVAMIITDDNRYNLPIIIAIQ